MLEKTISIYRNKKDSKEFILWQKHYSETTYLSLTIKEVRDLLGQLMRFKLEKEK